MAGRALAIDTKIHLLYTSGKQKCIMKGGNLAGCYSAYPLAAQQFYNEYGDDFKFEVTQVIGLSNGNKVSKGMTP